MPGHVDRGDDQARGGELPTHRGLVGQRLPDHDLGREQVALHHVRELALRTGEHPAVPVAASNWTTCPGTTMDSPRCDPGSFAMSCHPRAVMARAGSGAATIGSGAVRRSCPDRMTGCRPPTETCYQ